eukprot:5689096-Pyramimonas_sp.AAC.1
MSSCLAGSVVVVSSTQSAEVQCEPQKTRDRGYVRVLARCTSILTATQTSQTQEAQVYAHDGPMIRRKR